jgi:hypothetical protein
MFYHCLLQVSKFVLEKRRTLLQEYMYCLLHASAERSAYGFQKLVRQLIYSADYFLREYLRLCLYGFYRQRYLDLFQETNEMDCNKADYRNDVKQTSLLVFLQKLSSMIRDGIIALSRPTLYNHSLSGFVMQSIPSIVFHCKKLWKPLCLLSPRSVQYLLVYTYCAYQTPFLVCQTPNVTSVAGNSI